MSSAALRASVLQHLQAFTHLVPPPGQERAAAVALAITEEGFGADLPGLPRHKYWSSEAALILTRRAMHLRHHAGQWAMPGGRLDAGETPEQAALRELSEEVGLHLGPQDVLGRLDDYVSRSGFIITPVVVWAGAARGMQPNPGEVQSIHRIPVSEFMREDSPMLETLHDTEHPAMRVPVGTTWIAAPTAAMIYQFREVCIHGRMVRVAHFEEPEFARR